MARQQSTHADVQRGARLLQRIDPGYFPVVTDNGILIVYRTAGERRAQRAGNVDLRVDDRVRGQLRAGNTIELKMSAGRHRVRVGREAMVGLNRQLFVGSPVLDVTVRVGETSTVRVDPTSVPVRQQLQVSGSSYVLTDETNGSGGQVTPQPVAELDRYPMGLWMSGIYTRSLIHRRQPWFSWPGAASAFVLLYAAFLIARFGAGHHPANVAAWIWAVFVIGGGVMTATAWASLYRARRTVSAHQHS